jgi:hypothetical protein
MLLLLLLLGKSDRLNDEIDICHNILSIRIISFVKIKNLIRRLNCSCSWIYTSFPYGTPIIIICKSSEWVAWPSVSWVGVLGWQTCTMMLSMHFLCAWFDSIGDYVCVSIETNCHHHHDDQYDRQTDRQTGIDLKMKFSAVPVLFSFERRDEIFSYFSHAVCPVRRFKSIFIYHLY